MIQSPANGSPKYQSGLGQLHRRLSPHIVVQHVVGIIFNDYGICSCKTICAQFQFVLKNAVKYTKVFVLIRMNYKGFTIYIIMTG